MVQDQIIRTDRAGGFQRKESEFRAAVSAEPEAEFPAEAGRYHLYVAWACPWAHRTLLGRTLYGLDDAIGVSVVHWLMDDRGAWNFSADAGYDDPVNGARSMQDIYQKADPGFGGIGTVPVLWDKRRNTIVNNESREILRMLSVGFRPLHRKDAELLPGDQAKAIDDMISANYETINNGVYKAGFARTQDAYDKAIPPLFDRLDALEDLLDGQRYLLGNHLTEADICLFPTLLRFDLVYHYHFKCNLRRLSDYPNLWGYTRDIYQHPGVRETVDFADTKRHYFGSHVGLNPHRVVPAGPMLDYDAPHRRDERFS